MERDKIQIERMKEFMIDIVNSKVDTIMTKEMMIGIEIVTKKRMALRKIEIEIEIETEKTDEKMITITISIQASIEIDILKIKKININMKIS